MISGQAWSRTFYIGLKRVHQPYWISLISEKEKLLFKKQNCLRNRTKMPCRLSDITDTGSNADAYLRSMAMDNAAGPASFDQYCSFFLTVKMWFRISLLDMKTHFNFWMSLKWIKFFHLRQAQSFRRSLKEESLFKLFAEIYQTLVINTHVGRQLWVRLSPVPAPLLWRQKFAFLSKIS